MIEQCNTIIQGDARELSSSIPDNSIDLIFTDPPYPKEYLPLYGWLAGEAARVLKPGGFCFTYAGLSYKYDVMMALGNHLTYFWDFVSYSYWEGVVIWPRRILAKNKSILAFCKGAGLPRKRVVSIWLPERDKRYHVWGQDESTARYYIDYFSQPGDLIWEPFCGGGTVPYVCKVLGRNFIAYEIDPDTAAIARSRLEIVQPFLMPEEVYEQSPLLEKEEEVSA